MCRVGNISSDKNQTGLKGIIRPLRKTSGREWGHLIGYEALRKKQRGRGFTKYRYVTLESFQVGHLQ